MTAKEASQRAVMFMMESLAGSPLPKKARRRNRGAARRAKIAARNRSYTDQLPAGTARAVALAAGLNEMVDGVRTGSRAAT